MHGRIYAGGGGSLPFSYSLNHIEWVAWLLECASCGQSLACEPSVVESVQ